jgi:hypothetical protein
MIPRIVQAMQEMPSGRIAEGKVERLLWNFESNSNEIMEALRVYLDYDGGDIDEAASLLLELTNKIGWNG